MPDTRHTPTDTELRDELASLLHLDLCGDASHGHERHGRVYLEMAGTVARQVLKSDWLAARIARGTL